MDTKFTLVNTFVPVTVTETVFVPNFCLPNDLACHGTGTYVTTTRVVGENVINTRISASIETYTVTCHLRFICLRSAYNSVLQLTMFGAHNEVITESNSSKITFEKDISP